MSIFNAWKVLDQKNQVITSLWVVIGLLLIMNFYMFLGWKSLPLKQRFYFPPDLAQGGVFDNGHIPPGQIYAFGFHIFSAINTWSDVGSKDYEKTIHANRQFFSQKFYKYLLEEVKRKGSLNELNRRRVAYDDNTTFDLDYVKQLSANTWHVEYSFHVQESIGNNVFKEWVEVYPIIIRKVNASFEHNPWGLEITGFYKEPYRKKNIL